MQTGVERDFSDGGRGGRATRARPTETDTRDAEGRKRKVKGTHLVCLNVPIAVERVSRSRLSRIPPTGENTTEVGKNQTTPNLPNPDSRAREEPSRRDDLDDALGSTHACVVSSVSSGALGVASATRRPVLSTRICRLFAIAPSHARTSHGRIFRIRHRRKFWLLTGQFFAAVLLSVQRSLFVFCIAARARVEAAEEASAAMDPTEADDSDGFPSSGVRRRGPVFAGVEGGGTTWVAAVAVGEPDRIVTRADFPTTTPEETLPRIRDWLAAQHAERPFDALGVATFGPVDLDRQSPTYGHITHSPKPGWAAVDVLGALRRGWAPARLPVGFDTDVNAPAVAEFAAVQRELEQLDGTEKRDGRAGAFVRALFGEESDASGDDASGTDDDDVCFKNTDELRFQNLAYVTVGTGVGVGVVCGGEPVHGLSHPEAGHIRVSRLASDGLAGAPGAFEGACAYHGDCIEGMAGAAAIARRCGCEMSQLAQVPDDHPAWDAAAHYVAGMCAALVMVASPQRIVLGGGVLQRKTLVAKIRESLRAQLGGYVRHDFVEKIRGLKHFLVASRHGNEAGIVGALALAARARSAAAPAAARRRKRNVFRRLAHYFGFGVVSAFVTLKIVNKEVRVRGRKLL